jgi:outer membrane beta-barrel protein
MNRNILNVIGCLAVLLASSGASADEGELVEKVAVRNRLFTVAGRWELGGNFGLALVSRLTDHYNLNISGAYNFNEWLAVEARAGYAISLHSSLASQVQKDFYTNTSVSKANDMSDLWEMKVNGIVGVRFQPIYGKINLLAEVPLHFQIYGWLGGGAGLFGRESLVICPVKTNSKECGEYFTESKVSPIVSIALGFRFFLPGVTSSGTVLGQKHAIKLEVRDWSYLDSYYVGVDRAMSSAGNPTAGGMLSPNAGITNLVMFDLGYSFIF